MNNFKNQFLVAMPSMQGEFFAKSVVFIYEHSTTDGALGFTINKPLSALLGNMLEHLNIIVKDSKISDLPVFSGGPMGPDQGFVIHDQISLAGKDADTDKDVIITTTRAILEDIANGKGPKRFAVVLGYAGWEPGQLEKEIIRNDWLLVPFDKLILFDTPIARRWAAAAALIGIDINQLTSQAGHA